MNNFIRSTTKILCTLLLVIGFSNTWANNHTVQVATTNYTKITKVANSQLTLNGAGIRTKLFVKVYTLGLYVPKKSNSAEDLIAMIGPKLVEIHMLREVTAKKFIDALKDGLEDNNSEKVLDKLEPQIETLENLMHKIGKVKEGDIIKLEFNPASGTQLIVNENKIDKPIAGGAEFYNALLNIWLGDDPVDSSLKKSLLG
ncbi:MAG: chalcone isomerase family protein [Neisseriaceae bacterium]